MLAKRSDRGLELIRFDGTMGSLPSLFEATILAHVSHFDVAQDTILGSNPHVVLMERFGSWNNPADRVDKTTRGQWFEAER